jgi:hypothetical protein
MKTLLVGTLTFLGAMTVITPMMAAECDPLQILIQDTYTRKTDTQTRLQKKKKLKIT